MYIKYFLFRKYSFTIIMNMIIIAIFTNCTYQLCTENPKKIITQYKNQKYILLHSYDPFGLITKTVRIELYKNNIKILDVFNNNLDMSNIYACLHIINASEHYITTSVFTDGSKAGYQLILNVDITLSILNINKENNFPINIQVHRAFIKNFNYPLSNDVQENDMRQSMYQEAAEKIIFYINLQYTNYCKYALKH